MPLPAPATFAIALFQHAIDQRHCRNGHRLNMQDALAFQWGRQRAIWQEQDASLPAQPVPAGAALWLSVADGVSASPHAALASRSLLHTLHHPAGLLPGSASALPALVRAAASAWQSRYLRPATQGASTTLASLMIKNGQACAVNCGDSRIWRLRPNATGGMAWQQLSRDHTIWQHMLDEGEVSPEQRDAGASIYQGLLHCLTLGSNQGNEPDWLDDPAGHSTPPPALENWLHIWHGQVQAGDVFVLATDGLHDSLGDERLPQLWQAQASLDANVQALKAAYLQAGAPDDCSVVAVRVQGACA
ncbi:hypothetical protein CK623_09170 [Vandammella animalimorsus]|uniref:PPM-type phosphatase domain-containing protein n=1 Tax=Vandammella animalimorsus TaxID=2029117 RepID=A0A2A2APN0_9BURK|nr:protein phosphatase 2C domain-containing protein [Vandammella animalimorsus]PAT39681.1 hypothetical protein CK623_09170 [Vandammella animalimorsus]